MTNGQPTPRRWTTQHGRPGQLVRSFIGSDRATAPDQRRSAAQAEAHDAAPGWAPVAGRDRERPVGSGRAGARRPRGPRRTLPRPPARRPGGRPGAGGVLLGDRHWSARPEWRAAQPPGPRTDRAQTSPAPHSARSCQHRTWAACGVPEFRTASWIVVAEPITDVDTTAADTLHTLDVGLNDD